MNIKLKLSIQSYLQFFVWGAWLITIANYWFMTKGWDGKSFGLMFMTLGISSVISPAITGIIADKWLNAEKLYGILLILYAIVICCIPFVNDPNTFFWVMLLAMVFYMPTISLSYSISYIVINNNHLDSVKIFPKVRVFGTIGFIIAMWITNLTGNKASANMFYISAISAVILGIFSFTMMPKCKPQNTGNRNATFLESLGLNAFSLFNNRKMATFFIFSFLIGACLQLTNMYGDVFLSDYALNPKYYNSFVVERSTIIMSISQISETVFILAIPFFMYKFGIKKVMLFSIIAWVLRFALFSFGNPTDGLWMIILSCIIYGFAFDFFNVSGSLFVETSTNDKIRSSAQGLFMMMTNGFGSIFGALTSGYLIDYFYTHKFQNINQLTSFLQTDQNNQAIQNIIMFGKNKIQSNGTFLHEVTLKDWSSIWLVFSIYAIVLAVLFVIFFHHKHNPAEVAEVKH